MSGEWGRTSPMGGRHWLRRRDNAAWRLGFWDRIRSTWRVTDALGRTSGKSPFNVARLFTQEVRSSRRGAEAMSDEHSIGFYSGGYDEHDPPSGPYDEVRSSRRPEP